MGSAGRGGPTTPCPFCGETIPLEPDCCRACTSALHLDRRPRSRSSDRHHLTAGLPALCRPCPSDPVRGRTRPQCYDPHSVSAAPSSSFAQSVRAPISPRDHPSTSRPALPIRSSTAGSSATGSHLYGAGRRPIGYRIRSRRNDAVRYTPWFREFAGDRPAAIHAGLLRATYASCARRWGSMDGVAGSISSGIQMTAGT